MTLNQIVNDSPFDGLGGGRLVVGAWRCNLTGCVRVDAVGYMQKGFLNFLSPATPAAASKKVVGSDKEWQKF